MTSPDPYNYFRSWMDKPHKKADGSKEVTDEFFAGVDQFMKFATQQDHTKKTRKMYCPCSVCCNSRYKPIQEVLHHLYDNGFKPGYKVWYYHGENDSMVDYASTSRHPVVDRLEEPTPDVDNIGTVQMVNDAYREHITTNVDSGVREEPNLEARRFYGMLDAANQPLYDGCRDGLSPLYAATRMMSIKTDHNVSEECMDAFADLVKDLLPENNVAPKTYNAIEGLVKGLDLPYHMIDVCIDNCMLFWGDDVGRKTCCHCGKDRFKEKGGKVPYKRMWYLPLAERLKRLYQSERTAGAMRWHAEHRAEGEIAHPSDAEAWKHFQSVYFEFAAERRNVYLGLCTDGFNPFGNFGRQYSLWPVILTPYNLPPSLCMKREFLFLTVLIPGPQNPKKSFDVFLKPLIYELNQLWEQGTAAYDVSLQQNFTMRAVLMWTIGDFPAYGMLSGWTTQGRLSCPYCQDETKAFSLRHGQKTCWFDCHRRFLPSDHPYRSSKTMFKKNEEVFYGPPPTLDGDTLMTQLRDFGVPTTAEYGGNGHEDVYGYLEFHNWHKKSIFWDLPYWKDHLLRHNLDVMHIEKNFFENIMNTVLNVKGKTKDNLKSRLDLPEFCCRSALHIKNGRAPPPAFRLSAEKKSVFFEWICHSVKFPDGYVSNLGNCVKSREGKLSGMKSHDCHVVMQRLLPFAFSKLLPKEVHEAIADVVGYAGVGAFFRDICARSLTSNGIRNLEEKIPEIICNLEKKFPPSFFDVMEHLPIHLPREAALGGPVQYRWMYPFERYMFHLKRKVKNLSRVEGSIVAQRINQEASEFAAYYFEPRVQTRSRKPSRHDDGVRPFYRVFVPDTFAQIGRLSGKGVNRMLTEEEHVHLRHYIYTNCEEVQYYERIYEAHVLGMYPEYTRDEVEALKKKEFERWLKYYMSVMTAKGETVPTWLDELANKPSYVAKSYPIYCTRGYAFKVYREGSSTMTSNSGISTRSEDTVYYGILREILEIHYTGGIDLRCVVFYCDWYDPIEGRGVRLDKFGVTSVHSGRRLGKYDPFILASQADQVCYIPYPQVVKPDKQPDPWITATTINPRGRVYGVPEHDPLQQNSIGFLGSMDVSVGNNLVVDLTGEQSDEELFEDSENEVYEFEEAYDAAHSDSLSDSE